ncbi:Uncharacterized protein Fot_28642 [Forsythia ovata]|uniref:Uncharacterized protein n=1 Tax=Forsythia ovata TaxID=205694 RepID=A0ABD1TPL6_9LAMI
MKKHTAGSVSFVTTKKRLPYGGPPLGEAWPSDGSACGGSNLTNHLKPGLGELVETIHKKRNSIEALSCAHPQGVQIMDQFTHRTIELMCERDLRIILCGIEALSCARPPKGRDANQRPIYTLDH